MIKLDVQLYQLLNLDPRMPYRELANRLGTSTPAIHKRLQALTAAGVLRTATIISTSYLNASIVSIFGHIEAKQPVEEIINKLRKNECFSGAILCASNNIFIIGMLRRPTDMESFHSFVRETCQMKHTTLAIDYLNEFDNVVPSPPVAPEVKLSALDLRIVSSFHYDARKSYDKVAAEVGVSARTVRKHLERMIAEGSIELWTVVNPAANPDFFTIIRVDTKEGVDRDALGIDLMRRFPEQVTIFRTFCNLPNLIQIGSIHTKMSELYELIDILTKDDRVTSAVPHVLIRWWWSDTWRDEIIPGCKKRSIWPSTKEKTRSNDLS
jgi:DNA-binding Lrp family transcriptional regulator